MTSVFTRGAGAACALVALAGVGVAMPATDDASPVRSVAAVRRAGDVAIDGALSEAAWTAAPPVGDFWQREPHEGQAPLQPTEFRVLYDDTALYIGVRAFDSDPDKIRGLLTRRDGDSSSDWIFVGVDSYHDKRTSFTFAINPASVQRDLLIYDDVVEDASWDAVWEGAAAVDGDGWSAEFRIPYSQLRFSSADEQIWGLQVARLVQRSSEVSFWTPTPRDKQQRVSLFGQVDGIRDIEPSRRIELLPYTVGGARLRQVEPGDPFNDELGPELGIGLDFEYGVTPNLTLSGTLNPDFGQVEADPSEVNLTDQETFLQEKRPFFLEGADIFRFGLSQGDGDGAVEQLFYSRRIGAPPSVDPSGIYARHDATTNIIGAAKLSGKTRGGWSIGVLNATTAEEHAEIRTEAGDDAVEVIEPLANYSVLRLRKDFNDGRTNVGLAATGVHRALADTGLDFLHERAYSGGLQLSHRTANGNWHGDLRVMGSSVHGDAAAIDETQRASQRYFQRPDADHLDYDPTRTSLAGLGAMGSLSLLGGKHWRGAVGFDARSPGFEVNDLGFQRRADYAVNWVWSQYRDETPGEHLLNYSVNTNVYSVADWAPELLSVGGNVNAWATTTGFWSFGGGFNIDDDRLHTRLLRGGPAVRIDRAYGAFGNVNSDHRRRVRVGVGYQGALRPGAGNWALGGNANVSVQARSNLDLAVGPFVSRRVDDMQYVDTLLDTGGEPRYLLAHIDQTTVGMTLRASYTVSPQLSLQVYAQPFVSAGAYSGYKEPDQVRAARHEDRFHTFGADELTSMDGELRVDRDGDGVAELAFSPADFNFRQLRSTVVMRWEYRPGSTLFLIWSHDRSSDEAQGDFALGADLSDLADARGDHVLLAKLTYWWGA